jgi:hypothetical protein
MRCGTLRGSQLSNASTGGPCRPVLWGTLMENTKEMKMPSLPLNSNEALRAWAIEQAGGDVGKAQSIVEFVRPAERPQSERAQSERAQSAKRPAAVAKGHRG